MCYCVGFAEQNELAVPRYFQNGAGHFRVSFSNFMLVEALNFHLPPELIAQEPARPRDSARLLHVQRASNHLSQHNVADLPQLLRPDDLLIGNDSRVLRARLRGIKRDSGGRVEAFLLRELAPNRWQCLLKPSARLKPQTWLQFATEDGQITLDAQPIEREDETWQVQFFPAAPHHDVRQLLPLLGQVPLPPYIQSSAPESDYQTVYARQSDAGSGEARGLDSVAAPTAGLHFTPQLLERLQARGIERAFVTLGVGLGTFRPVQCEDLDDHVMHGEDFWIPEATAARIAAQKALGGRVVAIGTTAARALEAASDENGQIKSGHAHTQIFIRPGYRFRAVDALLTNFHLPRSTLLALVAAFVENAAGVEAGTGLAQVLAAYQFAIEQRYRFFSFGDAMLIE